MVRAQFRRFSSKQAELTVSTYLELVSEAVLGGSGSLEQSHLQTNKENENVQVYDSETDQRSALELQPFRD